MGAGKKTSLEAYAVERGNVDDDEYRVPVGCASGKPVRRNPAPALKCLLPMDLPYVVVNTFMVLSSR